MGCILSSEESSCSTMFGSCRNARCLSSCLRCADKHKEDIRSAAIKIEDVVDAAMARWVENHLREALQRSLPAPAANAIENALISAIRLDLVPRRPITPVPLTIEAIESSPEPMSPQNLASPTSITSPASPTVMSPRPPSVTSPRVAMRSPRSAVIMQ